jgi:hypothetical protein
MSETGDVIYKIEAFDKKTEFLAFTVTLPTGHDTQLAQIMSWSEPQRGHGGYDMSAKQAAAIETLTGSRFYDGEHIFQLTCYGA